MACRKVGTLGARTSRLLSYAMLSGHFQTRWNFCHRQPADIQLICDYRIKPIEPVEVGEIELAEVLGVPEGGSEGFAPDNGQAS